MEPAEGGYSYRLPAIIMAAAFSILLLFWFQQLPCRKSEEEELCEAIKIGYEEPLDEENEDQAHPSITTDKDQKPLAPATNN